MSWIKIGHWMVIGGAILMGLYAEFMAYWYWFENPELTKMQFFLHTWFHHLVATGLFFIALAQNRVKVK